MRLTISYNPYFLESSFLIDGESAADKSWATYLHRRHLQTWFYSAPNWRGMAVELEEALNEDKVDVEFEGRALDYRDLELYLTDWNQKEERRTTFHLLPQQKFLREEQNILQMLDELVSTFKDSPVEVMREPELMERYRQARNADFEMAVVATMSSGKSTLINALLGQDLLPSANDATTAKISRICDVDGTDGFSVSCRDEDENVVYEETAATLELLQEYNGDKEVFYVDLKGDIPGISNEALRLRLIDTPGPNNHATPDHRAVTNKIIQDKNQQPIILYVLDATKPEDESDAVLLLQIAEEIKHGGRQTQERFVFAMNKADELDEKKDGTVREVVERRQNYLHSLGIEATQIIPISARTAKLLRMGDTITDDDDLDNLDSGLKKARRKQFDQAAMLSPSCREKLERMKQEAQKQGDQYMLDLISTGIIGLELTINEYLEKYAYPYKISQIVNTFKKHIEDKLSHADYVRNISKDQEELKKARKELYTARKKKDALTERREELEKRVGGIDFDPKFLKQQIIGVMGEIGKCLKPIRDEMCDVNGEIYASQVSHFFAQAKKVEQNVLQRSQREMIATIKEKIRRDFDPVFDAYGAFIQEIRGTKISNIDFGNLEEVCRMEMVLDAISKNIDTSSMIYKKTHKQIIKNPERKGFFGFFRFTKPWEIEQEVSDGDYANIDELFFTVISVARSNLEVQFKQIETDLGELYEMKRQECIAFLMDLDNVIATELKRIGKLTEKVAENQLDLDYNQTCMDWMEGIIHRLGAVIQFQAQI